MVKFADDLQIRLDVHNKPYSRTQQLGNPDGQENPGSTIAALCESLEVNLSPTVSKSQAGVDAIILEAELISGKQQPDIGGIYWINGPDTAVSVAAEIFYTMEEVEWVFYKPVYSKMPKGSPQYDFNPPTAQATPKPVLRKEIVRKETVFGACLIDRMHCLESVGKADCDEQNGTFF